jgi:hypothetical protein
LPTSYALALVLSRALSLNAVDIGFLLVANVYVQAFGAVLATLSSSYRWREDRFTDSLGPDNAVLPGFRDVPNSLPKTDAAVSSDKQRDSESNMSEAAPLDSSPRPNFLCGRFSSSIDRRHPGAEATSAALLPTVDSITSIDPLPTSIEEMKIDLQSKVSTKTVNEASFHFPSGYTMQQYESRRSSDATLFAPLSGEKGEGLRRKTEENIPFDSSSISPSSSRPGTGGTGRMHRLGSSRSIPRDDNLLEVEESTSPTSPKE